MEHSSEFELIVYQGKLPLWKIIIASLFFSVMIYSFYQILFVLYYYDLDDIKPKYIPNLIELAALGLAGGISFSLTKSILIDIDQDKLVSKYRVGPFSRKVNSIVPQLDYVSVFLNDKEQYEVNLWYSKNKHYKMYFFGEKEPAIKFGQMVSMKLKIDLLDATEKGNSIWIEKIEP